MKMTLVHSGIMLLFYELHAVQAGGTELRVPLDDWEEFAAVSLLLGLSADDKKVWMPSTAANACVLQLSRAGLALTGGLVSCGLLQVMSGLARS